MLYPADDPPHALPFPMVFTPRWWEERESNWEGIPGMVRGSFRPAPSLRGMARGFAREGTADQWRNGFLHSEYLAGKIPQGHCIPVGVSCPFLPDTGPPTVYVTATGFNPLVQASGTALGGVYPLPAAGPCVWQDAFFPRIFPTDNVRWTLTASSGALVVTLVHDILGNWGLWSFSGSWDGRSDALLTLSSTVLPSGWVPETVTISLDSSGDSDVIPPGLIQSYAGVTAPSGWIPCNGTAVPITSPYDRLYSVIGHTWDTFRGQAAPGAGQFRVPLLNGMVVGASGTVVAASGLNPATFTYNPQDVRGEELAPISTGQLPAHAHPISDPGHAHALTDPGHTHGLTDPGHSHAMGDGYAPLTSNNASGQSVAAGVDLGDASSVAPAMTGATVDTAVTGATAALAVTGIISTSPVGSSDPIDRRQPTVYLLAIIKL